MRGGLPAVRRVTRRVDLLHRRRTHRLALAATVVLDAASRALALGVGRVAVGAAVRAVAALLALE